MRADFDMALLRFLKTLGIEFVEGKNVAVVDLFDMRHATEVLTAFGRAFGALPEDQGSLTGDRRTFLDQAVAGLAQDGLVVSVHLALFAEMMKGKPWTPSTLKIVGGTQGVGVAFLENKFDSPGANPAHRRHRRAAWAVLKALLPELGTGIKGNMKAYEALLDASGYAGRLADFDELLRVLDGELRLITPTDPAVPSASGDDRKDGNLPHKKWYQLTHDYLVPSVREWLVREQRDTWRGRAELLLAERSALWHAKPENRRLPSVWEWGRIRLLARSKDWTDPQWRMMRRARRVHRVRILGLAALIALMSWLAIETYGGMRATAVIDSLKTAGTVDVLPIIRQVSDYRRWADPRLREMVNDSDRKSRGRVHASLALLAVDPSQVDFLFNCLLIAGPKELPVFAESLRPHRSQLTPELWSELESAQPGDVTLLPAASALALYDSESSRWADFGGKVAEALVTANSLVLGPWLEDLRPVRGELTAPVAVIFRDKQRSEDVLAKATDILANYAQREPALLASLLMDADPKAFVAIFSVAERVADRVIPVFQAELARGPMTGENTAGTEQLNDELAERKARAAVALIRLGHAEEAWPLLRHSADPRTRSYIVNWLSPLGGDAHDVADELDRLDLSTRSAERGVGSRRSGEGSSVPANVGPGSPDPAVITTKAMDAILFHPVTSIRRALILALGTYGVDRLVPGEREPLIARLLDLYENDPDAGIHGAAEWTLQQWQQHEKLKELGAELMKLKDWGERRWYVDGQGQTFAVIEGPVEFRMGSPPTDTERIAETEPPRRMAIPRRFAIAAKEVTVEQFQRFLKLGGITIESYQLSTSFLSKFSPDPQGPWIAFDWYTAAHYCNWLSEQEGLPKEQWCYLPNEARAYAEGMSIPADVLERTGYRLPTEPEWEYACRAGTDSSRYYSHSIDLLDAYARYQANSKEHAWRCGSLFPNDLGLFDMLGNMWEWCQDSRNASKPAKKGIYNDVINISESIVEKNVRLLRGGSFIPQPALVRSAYRVWFAPAVRNSNLGFRPSRTYH